MATEKCRAELLRLSDKSSMTRFMKLKAVRNTDVVGFSRLVESVVSTHQKRVLMGILLAGSYEKAMHVTCMSYEECYTFILNCYDLLINYVRTGESPSTEEEMREITILLKTGHNQFSTLRKLYSEHGARFSELLKRIPMRAKTQEKTLAFLEYSTPEEAALRTKCGRNSILSSVTRMYHMLLDVVDIVYLEQGDNFIQCMDFLDTRSRTVLAREGCKSIDDVKVLLDKATVQGLGAGSRTKIKEWLKEIES